MGHLKWTKEDPSHEKVDLQWGKIGLEGVGRWTPPTPLAMGLAREISF